MFDMCNESLLHASNEVKHLISVFLLCLEIVLQNPSVQQVAKATLPVFQNIQYIDEDTHVYKSCQIVYILASFFLFLIIWIFVWKW